MNVDLHFLHTYKMFCDLRVPEPVDRDVWIQHMKKRTILILIDCN